MTTWNSPGGRESTEATSADAATATCSSQRVPPDADAITKAERVELCQNTDSDTVAILRLIDGDPIHERDRGDIVAAIISAGREHRLHHVDPNAVRARLAASVYPRCVGAVYAALRRAGVLEPVSWTTSTDKAGRNAGKPARLYRLADDGLEQASDG